MNKKEVIKLVVETKAISAFTRNFVEWLYRNGYVICTAREVVNIDYSFLPPGTIEKTERFLEHIRKEKKPTQPEL